MIDWDTILDEAETLAEQLASRNVDLSEAEGVLKYLVYKRYDSSAVSKYLSYMSESPPPRSHRSLMHFRNLKHIWDGWETNLRDRNKARAWGWAVRVARSRKGGRE